MCRVRAAATSRSRGWSPVSSAVRSHFLRGASDAMVTALEDLELLVLESESVYALMEQTPRRIGRVIEAQRKALQMQCAQKSAIASQTKRY